MQQKKNDIENHWKKKLSSEKQLRKNILRRRRRKTQAYVVLIHLLERHISSRWKERRGWLRALRQARLEFNNALHEYRHAVAVGHLKSLQERGEYLKILQRIQNERRASERR